MFFLPCAESREAWCWFVCAGQMGASAVVLLLFGIVVNVSGAYLAITYVRSSALKKKE